jgi:SWIM zinc finger
MVAVEVSERSVRLLADDRSFERGRAYFQDGRVRRFTVDGTSVTAAVDGTSLYRVQLVITAVGLGGRCNCPYGQEGVFCKHCVAVALAWLEEGGEVGEPRRQPVTDERLREFLRGQDPAWLADELLAAAQADPLLRAKLDVAAGADTHDAYDDRELRERLERTIEIGDFVEYAGAYSYFQGVGGALDAVADLVDAGFPDVAANLAEYALALLEGAAEQVDDSDGGLREAIDRAEEIHLDACTAGDPDPVALAELLFDRALASDYEVFLTVLPDYEPALGPAGMARYRELVERAWHDLPPKKPDDYGGRRFVVSHLMEQMAECVGGADALIEVLARDVTSGYDVLRIAQRLCADGRDDETLDWLDRGMAHFPPDSRLRSLAADCHVRAGRRAEAGELLWANFTDRPSLESYVALHDATAEQFPAWRDRAIAVLRAQPATSARFTPMPFARPAGHSVLVEVLLWEGDVEAAWQVAVDGGCRDESWLRLARERAATHPADAIPVLLAAADQAIGHKNRNSYRVAAGLLTEAGTMFTRCDREEDFKSHLAALRTTHRPKRALQEELDHANLP